MRFYHIALGFYIFNLCLAMINGLGIFQTVMPESSLSTSTGTTQITQLTDTMSQSNDEGMFSSITAGVGMIAQSFGYIKTVFIDSVCIACVASQYGIDARISLPFQAVYSFILIFGIYQFLTGRGTKIME